MKTFKLVRNEKIDNCLFGELFSPNGDFICFTLENYKKAIKFGRYNTDFTFSPRFGRRLPLILVPGRSGIRIHSANYPYELTGCVAPCTDIDALRLRGKQSQLAMGKVLSYVKDFSAHVPIDIISSEAIFNNINSPHLYY